MTDLPDYAALGQTEEEAALLREHDQNEELHPFTRDEDDEDSPFCNWFSGPEGNGDPCGDTEEGLMHNNTWRNVEPLLQ